MNRNIMAALLATIGAVVIVMLGFRALGSPERQRLARTDLRTVQTLANLVQQIDAKWRAEGKTLPVDLSVFARAARTNPISGAAFSYRPKSMHEYELCANFLTDNRHTPGSDDDIWVHPEGDYCFSLDAAQPVTWPPNYPAY